MDEEVEVAPPTIVGSITVNHPNLPEGADVEVFGLGVFPNNTTSEVTEYQANTYYVLTGNEFTDGMQVPEEPAETVAEEPAETVAEEPAPVTSTVSGFLSSVSNVSSVAPETGADDEETEDDN